MHNTEDTTIEQTATETPEIEELSDETLDRAPGRGRTICVVARV